MDLANIGFEKEKSVADYLKKRGYKILELNWAAKTGEIDIIAQHKKAVVFIEVKYRSSELFGMPQEFVVRQKQKKIIRTALIYIKQKQISSDIRFDVVAVYRDNIELIESAFGYEGGWYYF